MGKSGSGVESRAVPDWYETELRRIVGATSELVISADTSYFRKGMFGDNSINELAKLCRSVASIAIPSLVVLECKNKIEEENNELIKLIQGKVSGKLKPSVREGILNAIRDDLLEKKDSFIGKIIGYSFEMKPESFKTGLEREVSRVPPAWKGKGARDAAIWESLIDRCDGNTIAVWVSLNVNDFNRDDPHLIEEMKEHAIFIVYDLDEIPKILKVFEEERNADWNRIKNDDSEDDVEDEGYSLTLFDKIEIYDDSILFDLRRRDELILTEILEHMKRYDDDSWRTFSGDEIDSVKRVHRQVERVSRSDGESAIVEDILVVEACLACSSTVQVGQDDFEHDIEPVYVRGRVLYAVELIGYIDGKILTEDCRVAVIGNLNLS